MKRVLMLVVLVFSSSAAVAGVWEERALLERYLEQSQSLKVTLLAQAEGSQDSTARIRFDYDALLSDLGDVESKIEHYLNSPLRQVVWDDVEAN